MSTHDDPVVVDNGPVRVDFLSRSVTKKGAEDAYARAFWGFNWLVAAVVDPDGVRKRVCAHELGVRPLVFELQDGASRGRLTFTMTFPFKLEVTTDQQWQFALKDGRLEPQKGAPRIVNITQGDKPLEPFPLDREDPTKRAVVVTLIPGIRSPFHAREIARVKRSARDEARQAGRPQAARMQAARKQAGRRRPR